MANAVALYDMCPTALVFGMWDSTGPKGGLGSKFQRALVSEIVGVGAELGARTASRIDPTGIEKTMIYEALDASEDWTLDPERARREKGKPVPLKRGGEKAGTPAVINHGNVKPNIDFLAGGVTIDYAEQTVVLSLPALRRLRFQQATSGTFLDGKRSEAEMAARTALAALALAAVSYSQRDGYDLRSRCALRPVRPPILELVSADGSAPVTYTLGLGAARELVLHATHEAERVHMGWTTEPIDLKPMPKLVALIRRSRELSVAADTDAGNDEN